MSTNAIRRSPKKDPRNMIGKKLRYLRNQSQPVITQADLAARLEIKKIPLDQSMLTRIETGKRGVSDIEVYAIAKALRCKISDLFD